MFAAKARAQGAIGSIEALGDGLEKGDTTDFFRAVQARDGENVILSRGASIGQGVGSAFLANRLGPVG